MGVCYPAWAMTPTPDRAEIARHVSRLEGQLASVKAQLMSERPDCTKAATTLKAASRSFASLRRAFVACFLWEKFPAAAKRPDAEASSEYAALLDVINA